MPGLVVPVLPYLAHSIPDQSAICINVAATGLWALSPGFAARGISTGPAGGERQDAPQQQSGNGSGYAKNPLQQAAAQQIEGEIDGDSASPRLAVCHSRELRISPRKLNMAAKLVRAGN